MSADWDALRELFDGALERPVHERAAYLNERTQGNDALRREIESLLAAHGDADQFLSAPAFGPTTHFRRHSRSRCHTQSARSTRLTAGTRLGAFEILDAPRDRRHGRGLSRTRSAARPLRRHQDPVVGASTRRLAAGNGSSARRARSRSCPIPASARCTTSASPRSMAGTCPTWSWSCWTARRWRRGSPAARSRSSSRWPMRSTSPTRWSWRTGRASCTAI